MLSAPGRRSAAVVAEPVARGLLKLGFTPNVVTLASATVSIVIVLSLIPSGHLVWAAVLAGLATAFDMLDGTMARLSGGGTRFGATLDASCDRLTDGALFAAITWWLIYSYTAPASLVIASLVVLVGSQVISYVKARGEASGLKIEGGLVERPERLILGLGGVGLQGLGVPYAIDVALWLLAVGTLFTIGQRLVMACQDEAAAGHVPPPAGAQG